MEACMSSAPGGKDIWDRITALATILVPAAIALAGHFIAQGLQRAELANEERRAEQARVQADANTKIAQAGLINTFMRSLTSDNAQERRLAVEAVLIALPDQGPALVRTVARGDADQAVQAAAKSSLSQRVDGLVRDLFAAQAPVRIAAAQDLVAGWRNEPPAVAAVLDQALRNADNANGVYNAAVVLAEFTPAALRPNRDGVLRFAEVARRQGPKTEARVAALLARLER
jgi:hypothetical protein